jgi:pyruvate,orthophosphate dikinase
LQELVKRFKALIKERTGKEFPPTLGSSFEGAVGAVFGSWMNDRAMVYRRKYGIPSEWGTAVNVQAMVLATPAKNPVPASRSRATRPAAKRFSTANFS